MKSSSQESSSQPPCSPESPPWPPPTHWPPPAWMRSARSRPWLKQLLSAGKVYVLFSFPQRGASLSLSQERHLQPVKGGGLFRFPPPSTGDGYVQRPQVGASALRAARVVFSGAHQVAPNGFLGDPRCWPAREAATISPPSSMRDAVAYVTGSSFLSFLSFNSLPKGNTPISEFTQRG